MVKGKEGAELACRRRGRGLVKKGFGVCKGGGGGRVAERGRSEKKGGGRGGASARWGTLIC